MSKRVRALGTTVAAVCVLGALFAPGCGSSSGKNAVKPPTTGDAGEGGEAGEATQPSAGAPAAGTGSGGEAGAVSDAGAGGSSEGGAGGEAGAPPVLTGCALGDPCCAENQCESNLECLGSACSCVSELSGQYMLRTDGIAVLTPINGSSQTVVTNADTALPLRGIVDIMGTTYHGCAALDSGQVRCWPLMGDATGNNSGQLGNGTVGGTFPVLSASLVKVDANTPLTDIASVGSDSLSYQGTTTTCAVTKDKQLYCWGAGAARLINGATTPTPFATQIKTGENGPALTGVTQVSVGDLSACLLLDTGKVRCWGAQGGGPSLLPVYPSTDFTVPGTVTKVRTGYRSACALNTAGAVYCWGNGGTIGNGPTAMSTDVATRVRISADAFLEGVTDFSISYGGACALKSDHSIWCWSSQVNLHYATAHQVNGVPVSNAAKISTPFGSDTPRWVTLAGAEISQGTEFTPACGVQE